jgi:hypothetical protein
MQTNRELEVPPGCCIGTIITLFLVLVLERYSQKLLQNSTTTTAETLGYDCCASLLLRLMWSPPRRPQVPQSLSLSLSLVSLSQILLIFFPSKTSFAFFRVLSFKDMKRCKPNGLTIDRNLTIGWM